MYDFTFPDEKKFQHCNWIETSSSSTAKCISIKSYLVLEKNKKK